MDRIELPDGSIARRELLLHPGAVAILPLLPDGRVLLVKQYRHAVSEELWEIPAGKIEQSEEPLACAERELLEETGYRAAHWEEAMTFYTSPGFTDERITLFLARDLTKIAEPRPEEIAALRSFEQDELERRIKNGTLRDGKTILALRMLTGSS